jgi:hypothetical protein
MLLSKEAIQLVYGSGSTWRCLLVTEIVLEEHLWFSSNA